jgi:hypothetical protein
VKRFGKYGRNQCHYSTKFSTIFPISFHYSTYFSPFFPNLFTIQHSFLP